MLYYITSSHNDFYHLFQKISITLAPLLLPHLHPQYFQHTTPSNTITRSQITLSTIISITLSTINFHQISSKSFITPSSTTLIVLSSNIFIASSSTHFFLPPSPQPQPTSTLSFLSLKTRRTWQAWRSL